LLHAARIAALGFLIIPRVVLLAFLAVFLVNVMPTVPLWQVGCVLRAPLNHVFLGINAWPPLLLVVAGAGFG
jgi:hypothetical protein